MPNLEFIISNLKFAREVIAAFPDPRISLATFHLELTDEYTADHPETCGSLFCGYGLLATIPKFRAMGIRLSNPIRFHNEPPTGLRRIKATYNAHIKGLPMHSYEGSNGDEELNKIFGKNAYNKLFTTRGSGVYDFMFLSSHSMKPYVSDKQLLLSRFDRHISNHVAALSNYADK